MRLTVKAKLALAFSLIILLSAVTALLGISNLSSLNATLDNVVRGPMQRVIVSQESSEQLLAIVRAEKNLNLSDTKEQADAFRSELARLRPEYTAQLDKAVSGASVAGRPLWEAARSSWQQYTALLDKIIDATNRDARPEARALSMGSARQSVTDARAALQKVVDLNRQRLTDATNDATHEYETARLMMIVVVCASLLIATATGSWIAFGIGRGLGRAGVLAQAVAGGDLTQTATISSHDEIGDLIGHVNAMVAAAARRRDGCVGCGGQRFIRQRGIVVEFRATVAGCYGTGFGGGASVFLDGADGASNIKCRTPTTPTQTEKIARQSAQVDAQRSW